MNMTVAVSGAVMPNASVARLLDRIAAAKQIVHVT